MHLIGGGREFCHRHGDNHLKVILGYVVELLGFISCSVLNLQRMFGKVPKKITRRNRRSNSHLNRETNRAFYPNTKLEAGAPEVY